MREPIRIECDESLKRIDVRTVNMFKEAGVHSSAQTGLVQSLEGNGFRFPLFIWFDENNTPWSVDGNGRVATIIEYDLKTEDGSYDYPYVEIKADDRTHAIELLFEAEKKYNKFLNRESFDSLAGEINSSFEEMEFDYQVFEDWDSNEGRNNEVDYSSTNKEVFTDDFDDEMILKLKYTEDEYRIVKDALLKIAQTPEQAVWQLLETKELINNEEQ